MLLKKSLYPLLVSTLLAGFMPPPVPSDTFRLSGDVQTFPLRIIDAFPFIEGEVNGRPGKFMFDTGNADDLDLNSHLLKLPTGRPLGQGSVGSGQKFTRAQYDTIANVRLSNGLAYKNLLGVEGNSYDFLEGITPDCIGQIGFSYVKGYILKIDYTQRLLTCYQQTAARRASQDFLRGERVVAILDVETRNRPGNVVARVKIGGYDFLCGFDTGQQGQLYLPKAVRQALLAKKLLVPLPVADGDSLYTIRQVDFGRGLKLDLHALNAMSTRNQIMDKALGYTQEPNLLTVGYAFLSQFTTVWNSEANKMYLCAPK
jgi:hypothetical protein